MFERDFLMNKYYQCEHALKLVSGSCYDECGYNDGTCWCDAGCVNIGDCCEDFAETCPGQI